MSSMSDAGSGASSGPDFNSPWKRGRSCRMQWSATELLAMVLGFMVYWPIGLAVIAWKMVRRRQRSGGDWISALKGSFAGGGFGTAGASWRGSWDAYAPGRSGNAAFDEWRKAEVERLEAERRKLEEAQRAFADFAEEARRARDREEFERFMAKHRSV